MIKNKIDDYLKITIETYEKNAEEYKIHRKDASPIAELEKLISYCNGGYILDAGCGPGRDTIWLLNKGIKAFGIDLCDSFLRIAREDSGINVFAKMNLLEMSFPQETFDGIWCCVVLSHLKKSLLINALKELNRVLKRGGVLFIAVKKGSGEGFQVEKEFANSPRYVSHFLDEEVLIAIEKSGFKTLEQYYYNEYKRHGGTHRDIDYIFNFSKKVKQQLTADIAA
jgi:SAM-dependent methyltransferase